MVFLPIRIKKGAVQPPPDSSGAELKPLRAVLEAAEEVSKEKLAESSAEEDSSAEDQGDSAQEEQAKEQKAH